MAEEKIIVTIGESGELGAETLNFEGPACLETLEKLLDGLGEEMSRSTKDEYYKSPKAGVIVTRRS